jgi:hypothetical protein
MNKRFELNFREYKVSEIDNSEEMVNNITSSIDCNIDIGTKHDLEELYNINVRSELLNRVLNSLFTDIIKKLSK